MPESNISYEERSYDEEKSKKEQHEESPKKKFMRLYNQLPYDQKNIVMTTFRGLASYEEFPEKGYQPYDVAGLIDYHQKKLNYTNKEVCNKVNEIIKNISTISKDLSLSEDTFYKIKLRNSQSSKNKVNWLEYIAQALGFDSDEYKKYLTDEGIQRSSAIVTTYSNRTNSINDLYDMLSDKEQAAILQLTVSLMNLSAMLDT